ncbi:hypothetical protein [Lactobacillus sp. PV034]|uniref:Rgg family transcriptional regulator n=1 Tax=Lactobacillus sp. PV034 TaxID=2594495 RepID=UPI00223F8E8A|nr:hypothetical protein [Lactobacillus sp. PV034]QNQ80210.1 hypothetical protein FP432_00890 [Lactobacillus sp. PV034]
MIIGDYLRQQRLALKLSRKEFSKNVIDSSHLAHIENNRNEIRAVTFIELLNENNISIFDFLENFGSFHAQSHALQIKASEAFFNKDVAALEELIKTNPYPHSVSVQVIKFMINKLNGQMDAFPRKSRAIIKKYLLAIEDWDENCLWILANSVELYDMEEIERIVDWLMHSERDFGEYTDYHVKLLAQIVINYLKQALRKDCDHGQIAQAYQYLEELPNRSIIFYEKLEALYMKAAQKGRWDQMFAISQYLDLF